MPARGSVSARGGGGTPVNNRNIAQLLRQIAVLLDEQGVAFKPAAYRRGAQTIEELPFDVATYKTEKELMELPGIGPAIAGKVFEFLQTGRMHTLDELLAAQGGISPELLMVEDLGVKRARQFQSELGIHSVPALIAAAREGKLRHLPRMSELLERKILENALQVSERSRRFARAEVERDVDALLSKIRALPGVEKAEVAGSYRRRKSTVGDIDIAVVSEDPKTLADAVARLPLVEKVVAHGSTKVSFNLRSGLRVDVRFVEPKQWGAALLYFTGDKEHNIALRKRAIERGWKLNEYGLFDGEKAIASEREEDIYQALDLPFIEPEARTGDVSRTGGGLR